MKAHQTGPSLGGPSERRAEVLRLIDTYEAEDTKQAQMKGKFLAFLKRSADPGNRQNYDPGHLTASAVVLDVPLCNVLLVYHCTLKGWLQPGGHVEVWDGTMAQAAVRECHEETGVILQPSHAVLFDLDIHPVAVKSPEPEHLHYDVRFLFVTPEKRTKSESAEADVRWYSLTEQYLPNDMNRLLKKCVRYRDRCAI